MGYRTNSLICQRLVPHTFASLQHVLFAHQSRQQHICKQRQQQQQRYRQLQRHQLFSKQQLIPPIVSMSTNPSADNNIHIRVIQRQDHQRVLDFLRIHYYLEEPLTVGTEPKQPDKQDEEFNMSNIEHGTCLMAVDKKSDAILGAVLAGPKGPDEAEHLLEEAAEMASEGATKWATILKFLAYVERDVNVCPRFGVEKVLHAHVIGVDTKTRGQNIGGRLMNELKILGTQLKYQLLTTDCTSYYSAKMCERLGWECVNTAYYRDYLDENQTQLIRSVSPHECCKTYAVQLWMAKDI